MTRTGNLHYCAVCPPLAKGTWAAICPGDTSSPESDSAPDSHCQGRPITKPSCAGASVFGCGRSPHAVHAVLALQSQGWFTMYRVAGGDQAVVPCERCAARIAMHSDGYMPWAPAAGHPAGMRVWGAVQGAVRVCAHVSLGVAAWVCVSVVLRALVAAVARVLRNGLVLVLVRCLHQGRATRRGHAPYRSHARPLRSRHAPAPCNW